MDEKRLRPVIFLALIGALMVATAGCTGPISAPPTPTTWYLVVTSTPAPSPTKFVPKSPTQAPPTTVPPSTPMSTPAATPPPLPTRPSPGQTTPTTRPPTAPPLPPTAAPVPPTPTVGPTFTPVPPAGQCQGDEEMSFDPVRPKVGDRLTVKVTSAKAHRNVRLTGPGSSPGPDKVEQGGKGYIWSWYITVPQAGNLGYTFYIETTIPCTANSCPADAATGVQLTCSNPNGTGAPGTTVKIMVTMKNTGGVQDTFNVNISKAVPAGWNAAFCFGSQCFFSGPVPRTLGPGASEQIEVDLIIPDGAPVGQQGSATISVISQSNATVTASITVSATRQ